MARKKSVSLPKAVSVSDLEASLQELSESTKGQGKFLSLDEIEDLVEGIPLRDNLPLQYMLGVSVFPLHRLVTVVGESASGKSSFCWYLAKLFQDAGGLVIFLDVEGKTNADQVKGILGSRSRLRRIKWVPTSECKILEQMLALISYYCSQYEALVPSRNIPMLILIDSLNSAIPNEVAEAVKKGETPNLGYVDARAAQQIKQNIRANNGVFLANNPICIALVNHLTADMKEGGGGGGGPSFLTGGARPTHTPGGGYKDYAYTNRINMRKGPKSTKGGEVTPIYKLDMDKASTGPERPKALEIPYRSEWLGSQAGPDDPVERIWFDWDTSLAFLLGKQLNKGQVKPFLDLSDTDTADQYTLNGESLTGAELGRYLHTSPEMYSLIQDRILKIKVKHEIVGPGAAPDSGRPVESDEPGPEEVSGTAEGKGE